MVDRNQFTKNSPGEIPEEHDEGIFPHKCVTSGCEYVVQYDDEPWCFKHSPDEGSSLRGYSARRAAESVIIHNVFDQN